MNFKTIFLGISIFLPLSTLSGNPGRIFKSAHTLFSAERSTAKTLYHLDDVMRVKSYGLNNSQIHIHGESSPFILEESMSSTHNFLKNNSEIIFRESRFGIIYNEHRITSIEPFENKGYIKVYHEGFDAPIIVDCSKTKYYQQYLEKQGRFLKTKHGYVNRDYIDTISIGAIPLSAIYGENVKKTPKISYEDEIYVKLADNRSVSTRHSISQKSQKSLISGKLLGISSFIIFLGIFVVERDKRKRLEIRKRKINSQNQSNDFLDEYIPFKCV